MEKWQIIEKINYLKSLNEDPVERPCIIENRKCHIERWQKELKILEELEKEEEDEI